MGPDPTPVRRGRPGTTTVLLADDQLLLGVGVTALLEAAGDVVVVGHALNGAQAVEMAQQLRPHVVQMDLSMPTMDGVHATRLIHALVPEARIVVLTTFQTQLGCEMHSMPWQRDSCSKTASPLNWSSRYGRLPLVRVPVR